MGRARSEDQGCTDRRAPQRVSRRTLSCRGPSGFEVATDTTAATQLGAENPWPGLDSFEESARASGAAHMLRIRR